MITAKEAYSQTKELIQKDMDELHTRCQHFVDTVVNDAVVGAINNRKMYCGVEVPKELKSATTIIQKKIEEAGFNVSTTGDYVKFIGIGWMDCE